MIGALAGSLLAGAAQGQQSPLESAVQDAAQAPIGTLSASYHPAGVGYLPALAAIYGQQDFFEISEGRTDLQCEIDGPRFANGRDTCGGSYRLGATGKDGKPTGVAGDVGGRAWVNTNGSADGELTASVSFPAGSGRASVRGVRGIGSDFTRVIGKYGDAGIELSGSLARKEGTHEGSSRRTEAEASAVVHGGLYDVGVLRRLDHHLAGSFALRSPDGQMGVGGFGKRAPDGHYFAVAEAGTVSPGDPLPGIFTGAGVSGTIAAFSAPPPYAHNLPVTGGARSAQAGAYDDPSLGRGQWALAGGDIGYGVTARAGAIRSQQRTGGALGDASVRPLVEIDANADGLARRLFGQGAHAGVTLRGEIAHGGLRNSAVALSVKLPYR